MEGGITVTTDKGDEIITDAVMFATGEMQFCGKVAACVWGNKSVDFVVGLIFQQPFGIQKHDTCSIHCTSTQCFSSNSPTFWTLAFCVVALGLKFTDTMHWF